MERCKIRAEVSEAECASELYADQLAAISARMVRRQVMGMFIQAFPDIHENTEDVIAEGDRVAVRGYFTGTHNGEFMNIPATGKQINVAYMATYRLENGKVVENWVQMDMLGMMQQLGVIPQPGAA
jgi:predicted ester cyclase